jgi:lysophospholipid acyltransferase (LPLAT)-like uncharacterized protein
MKSWDGFIVPKPFARVTVAYGDPVEIVAEDARAAAARAAELEEVMNEATKAARA